MTKIIAFNLWLWVGSELHRIIRLCIQANLCSETYVILFASLFPSVSTICEQFTFGKCVIIVFEPNFKNNQNCIKTLKIKYTRRLYIFWRTCKNIGTVVLHKETTTEKKSYLRVITTRSYRYAQNLKITFTLTS